MYKKLEKQTNKQKKVVVVKTNVVIRTSRDRNNFLGTIKSRLISQYFVAFFFTEKTTKSGKLQNYSLCPLKNGL